MDEWPACAFAAILFGKITRLIVVDHISFAIIPARKKLKEKVERFTRNEELIIKTRIQSAVN